MGGRKKRGAQLPRQLALGLLEDAMGRVQPQEEQEQQQDEPAVAYPSPEHWPTPPGTPDRTGLQATGVPVDNSAARIPRAPTMTRIPGPRRSASNPPHAPGNARAAVR